MKTPNEARQLIEVFVGTLGISLVGFGIYYGIGSPEKFAFIPLGVVLAGFVYWRQRKRRSSTED